MRRYLSTGARNITLKRKGTPSADLPEKMERHHSAHGLGSAIIHSHYEYLGKGVPVPQFLKYPKTVSVIGAPISWGQPRAGTDQGPDLLRDAGVVSCLKGLQWVIDERNNVKFDEPCSTTDPQPDETKLGGKAKNCYCLGKSLEKVYREAVASMAQGHFCLTLGGDHSIGMATVAAALTVRPETGVIWVDAHGDLNTPASSPSGNIHGMPLGFLMGLVDIDLLPGFEWLKEVPVLRPEQLVYVGLRDLDPVERDVILEMGIKSMTMHHIDRYGIGKAMEYAIEHLTFPNGMKRPLHMSYDIDAVDPEFAPSTGTVVRGGFSFREAHYIAEAVSNTGSLGSFDLVEVNPTLTSGPEAELTVNLGMALIASAMGSRIL